MPQSPIRTQTASPARLRQDLGYIPARELSADSGSGVDVSGGPSGQTISLSPIPTGTVLGNVSGSDAIPTAIPLPSYSSVIFAQTSSVTVVNTVTETTLLGSGVGSLTLPADSLSVGDVVMGIALGPHSASGTPNIRLRVYLNSTVILDTGNQTCGNSTDAMWEFRGVVTVRAIGASGEVEAQGFYIESAGGTNLFGMVNLGTISIDTTVDQTFDFTVEWGTASTSNSITCPLVVIQYLPAPI